MWRDRIALPLLLAAAAWLASRRRAAPSDHPMNTGLRPIPDSMPLDRAAELMVRRGEAPNFYTARARIARQRQRAKYGRTTVSDADRDMRARVESPRNYRFPYAD